MATFGNLLARKGGTAQTGAIVTFTLEMPGPDRNGPRIPTEAKALLLPVSVARRARALRAAEAYVARCEDEAAKAGTPCEAPSLEEERAIRFLVEAMRDPDDSRVYFVGETELAEFREAIIVEQINYISEEYNKLKQREYFELRPEDPAKMRADARTTF